MVDLLIELIPMISTTLLKQELVLNSTTNAPHEYAYQFELFALLQWTLTHPAFNDCTARVIPEAKDAVRTRQRIDIVVINHGVYVIELGANMSPQQYQEHLERTCTYMKNLARRYSTKPVFGIVINFTTDETQKEHFPSSTIPNLSCMNVHVDLQTSDVYTIARAW